MKQKSAIGQFFLVEELTNVGLITRYFQLRLTYYKYAEPHLVSKRDEKPF